MKIIIISNFPCTLDGSYGGRFTTLAKLFYDNGHDVELIVADFDHATKSRIEATNPYPFKLTFINEPSYAKNVSPKRLYAHYVWGKNVANYLAVTKKPDIIYCAIPSLTAAYLSANFSKRNGVKFVVDLQDLWPEAFAMAIKNKILQKLFLPMMYMANKAYAAADLAVAVSDTYVKRILSVNNKLKNGISVFLGNDGTLFDEGRDLYQLDRTVEEFVLGYIGNMSTSYDIPRVLDALKIVVRRNGTKKPVRFVLIGGGVDAGKFADYAKEVYPNTTFLGSKPYKEMAGLVCCCDAVVNPIVSSSVASIINKVGDYAFSGLPVINNQVSPEYRKLIDDYHCGINCKPDSAESLADAIEKLANDEALCKAMGANSLKLGRDKFDRRYTYKSIIKSIEEINI